MKGKLSEQQKWIREKGALDKVAAFAISSIDIDCHPSMLALIDIHYLHVHSPLGMTGGCTALPSCINPLVYCWDKKMLY